MNKLFSSKLEVLKLVKQHCPNLDINRSSKSGYFVALEDGAAFYEPNLRYWLERFNKECGMKFNQHMSRKLGRNILIYVDDNEVDADYLNLKKNSKKEDKVVKEEKLPEVVEEQGVEETKLPLSEIDLDFAKEFKYKDDVKAAKLALDEYASKYGVELSRRKSINNMLKDLEEAVNKA